MTVCSTNFVEKTFANWKLSTLLQQKYFANGKTWEKIKLQIELSVRKHNLFLHNEYLHLSSLSRINFCPTQSSGCSFPGFNIASISTKWLIDGILFEPSSNASESIAKNSTINAAWRGFSLVRCSPTLISSRLTPLSSWASAVQSTYHSLNLRLRKGSAYPFTVKSSGW